MVIPAEDPRVTHLISVCLNIHTGINAYTGDFMGEPHCLSTGPCIRTGYHAKVTSSVDKKYADRNTSSDLTQSPVAQGHCQNNVMLNV